MLRYKVLSFCHMLMSFVYADMRSESILNVTQRAIQEVHREDTLFMLRHQRGIDKVVENFTKIEPELFEETLGRATVIEKYSRYVNWVAYFIRKDDLRITLRDVLSAQTSNSPIRCPFNTSINCIRSKYRSIDGTCNNLLSPLRGAAFTPFARDLDPVYEQASSDVDDKDDQPRQTGQSGSLPKARVISRAIHQNTDHASPGPSEISFFFTAWGQFLAHIITDRAMASGYNMSKVDCCDQRLKSPNSECFNIDVPNRDVFRNGGRTCLPLHRSLETTDLGCTKGQRQQLNAATSYIDASAVYGSTEEKAAFLRTHKGGLLATSVPDELPFKAHGNSLAAKQGFAFVQAGDPRAAEITPLVGMHTIWVREHNRIAKLLSLFNSLWSDEKLYQESRRIVAAMIQHITYKEWLPLLLGPRQMNRYGLNPYTSGYYRVYRTNIDASTTNVVSTAAFRFGHSLVSPSFNLYNKDYSVGTSPALSLKDLFLRPNMYFLNEHSLMRGLLVNSSQPMDPFVTPDLANRLMETRSGNGGDLVAINIQRGRDHGLPSYNAWRRSVGLSTATSFASGSDGFEDIPAGIVQALSQVYSDPEDVDVWTGGVSETPVESGTIGPLFANILGRQFSRYRRGDRFWYETAERPQAFTTAQLSEIRKTTLARVICNNIDVDTIQPEAFKLSNATRNDRKRCSEIPILNLLHWRG